MKLFVFYPEALQQREFDFIFPPPAGSLAGYNIAQIGHREYALGDGSGSGFGKIGNAIGGKDEVHIIRAGLDLHEILSRDDFLLKLLFNGEPKLAQSRHLFRPLPGDWAGKMSTSCVVPGYPSRMAPLLPMNEYSTASAWKAEAISCA